MGCIIQTLPISRIICYCEGVMKNLISGGVFLFIFLVFGLTPLIIQAPIVPVPLYKEKERPSLPAVAETPSPSPASDGEVVKVWITAYSSSPDETDDTPFITAASTETRHGIVAANFLPLGTMVRIPEIFGDEIFVVEDRMHPRKRWVVDVWMSSKEKAETFGSYLSYIEVVKKPKVEQPTS